MLRRLSRLPPARLRLLLALILLVILCVPAVVAGTWFYNYTWRTVSEQVDYELRGLATHNARLIEAWLNERRFDLGVIGRLTVINDWVHAARAAGIGSPARDSLENALEERRRFFEGRYIGLDIYDPDARPLSRQEASTLLDASRFRAALRGERAVSSRRLGHPDSVAVLEVYAPVVDANRTIQGVILALTPMAPMYELLTDFAPGFSEHGHLIDSAGRALNVSGERVSQFETPATPGQLALLHEGPPATGRYADERGVDVIGIARKIPALGWWLIVERDEREAFARLDHLKRVLWGVFAAIVALGSVLSVMIARVAVHRLEQRENELRSTHEQLIAADRLASVGMMAASIAHEINNPLTTIKVLMHSLRERHAPVDSHRADLEIILSEIDKIKSLILRFLQFARPRDPEFGIVHLSETLSRIAALIRPQAQGQRQTVVEDYDPAAAPVWADASQIGQVFLNILLNAMDATPPGGEIRISTKPGGRGTVRVTIWNSGQGLAPELADKIFEPFFSTKTNGTGLGLSIARTIVEKHHGTISARGHGDKGTSFDIRLNTNRRQGP